MILKFKASMRLFISNDGNKPNIQPVLSSKVLVSQLVVAKFFRDLCCSNIFNKNLRIKKLGKH